MSYLENDQIAKGLAALAAQYKAQSSPPFVADPTLPTGVQRTASVVREGIHWYGVDDPALPPLVQGTKSANVGDPNNGQTIAAIEPGMSVRNLKIKDAGMCFRASNPAGVDGFTIEHIDAENLYRLVEGDAGVSLTNFKISDVRVIGLERSVARLRGASGPGLIKGVYADALGVSGDSFPMGFHFDENCHDITVDGCMIKNFTMPYDPAKYRQGDGYCDEGGCSNIVYRDCYALGCTDGGFDLKSQNVLLDNVVADRCRKNYRFWGTGNATTLTSISPLTFHIALSGDYIPAKLNMRIEKLVIRSNNTCPIIAFDGRGALHVESWDIQVPPGTPLYFNGNSRIAITWGPQGQPPLVF